MRDRILMIGVAVSPAILGSIMNSSYSAGLQASLPPAAIAALGPSAAASLNDPRAPAFMLPQPPRLGGRRGRRIAIAGTFEQ